MQRAYRLPILVAMSASTTEQIDRKFADLDKLSTIGKLRLINSNDARAHAAVERQLERIAVAVDVLTETVRGGGRVVYVGCGTSGRLAVLDASECPVTFGIPPSTVIAVIAGGNEALTRSMEGVEDEPLKGERDLIDKHLTSADAVVGIASSGSTPYVLGAVRYAKSLGCRTIGVTCNERTTLSSLVDVPIEVVVGAEVIAGSTRMAAGTAQKMVLNMLSTTTMLNNNRCYGNLMVSFNARACAKLRRRAVAIMRNVVDRLTESEAEEILRVADFDCKTALVIAVHRCSVEEAVAKLDAKQGSLRDVIG